jgi:DNA-binding NarL/FixJ family response regulator
MPHPVRVVVADDHTLVRAGLVALLGTIPDVEVVAEASHGRAAIEAVARLRPDVVLMDVSMPELNGLEATERIVQDFPGTRVLIVSMVVTEEYVAQALRSGASGYLLKDAEAVELRLAMSAVMRGDTYLSPSAARHATLLARRATQADDPLTSRQREILQLVVEGATSKDIARKLNISTRTVETHRMQLMDRLGIRDLPGLVRYAIKIGLVPPER